MRKILRLSLLVAVFSLVSCTNGVISIPQLASGKSAVAWKQSGDKVFTGNFVKDGQKSTYRLTLKPTTWKEHSETKVLFGADIQFAVQGGDYKAQYSGSMSFTGDVSNTDDAATVNNVKLSDRTIFEDIDPLIYQNIWPSVELSTIQNLSDGKVILQKGRIK